MKSRPVKIRLPETWLAKIEERCREEGIPVKPPPGKTGGPAEWIRRIIAKEINEEMFDPHTKLPIQKGQKNFAHGHNLRVWLVDKNLYPKGNPMGLGLVVNSEDFLCGMIFYLWVRWEMTEPNLKNLQRVLLARQGPL